MIARRWPSQQSAIGSALDPLGDKILVASVCVAMTYANVLPRKKNDSLVTSDLRP